MSTHTQIGVHQSNSVRCVRPRHSCRELRTTWIYLSLLSLLLSCSVRHVASMIHVACQTHTVCAKSVLLLKCASCPVLTDPRRRIVALGPSSRCRQGNQADQPFWCGPSSTTLL